LEKNIDFIGELEYHMIQDLVQLKSLCKKFSNLQKTKDSDKKECRICFENYSNDHKESCINLCGHRFGNSCLEKLQPKRVKAM